MRRRLRSRNLFEHSPAETYLLVSFGVRHWPERPHRCRVLDLGCAAGRLLYEVAHRRPEADLFGLEVQSAPLQQAEQALARRGMRLRRLPRLDTAVGLTGAVQIVPGAERDAAPLDSRSPGAAGTLSGDGSAGAYPTPGRFDGIES